MCREPIRTTREAVLALQNCGRCGAEWPTTAWHRSLREFGWAALIPGGGSGAVRMSLPVCRRCRVAIEILEDMPALAPIAAGVLLLTAKLGMPGGEWPEPYGTLIVFGWLPLLVLLRALSVRLLPVRVLKIHRDRTFTCRFRNAEIEPSDLEAESGPGKPAPRPAPRTGRDAPPEPDAFAVEDARETASARMRLYAEEERRRRSANVVAVVVIVLGVAGFAAGVYLRVSKEAEVLGWSLKGVGVSLIVLGKTLWRRPQRLTRDRRYE